MSAYSTAPLPENDHQTPGTDQVDVVVGRRITSLASSPLPRKMSWQTRCWLDLKPPPPPFCRPLQRNLPSFARTFCFVTCLSTPRFVLLIMHSSDNERGSWLHGTSINQQPMPPFDPCFPCLACTNLPHGRLVDLLRALSPTQRFDLTRRFSFCDPEPGGRHMDNHLSMPTIIGWAYFF